MTLLNALNRQIRVRKHKKLLQKMIRETCLPEAEGRRQAENTPEKLRISSELTSETPSEKRF